MPDSAEEFAEQKARQYVQHVQDFRNDLLFEIEMRYNLDKEEAEKLFEEAQTKGGHYA